MADTDSIAGAKPKIVYIFGAGHSGSTLLDVLLGCHSDVAGLGEVHRLSISPDTRQCGCGQTILQCDWWRSVISCYQAKHDCNDDDTQPWWEKYPLSLPRQFHQIGPGAQLALDLAAVLGNRTLLKLATAALPGVARYLASIHNSHALFDCVAAEKRVRLVVDSTKNALRGKALYMSAPSRFMAIHLVRDGRAVAMSAMHREGVSMAVAAKDWKRANFRTDLVLRSIPSALKARLRYEDICRAPLESINTIFSTIGLSAMDLHELQLPKVPHQIPGNPFLFNGISNIKLDEKWRRLIKPEDEATFQRIAGAMNRSFGYV